MIDSIIRKHLIPSEDYIYGFADLRGLLDRKFDGFPFGISIGRKLDDRIVDGLKYGPTLEYYHHYRQVNHELSVLTNKIRCGLSELNIESVCIEPTISLNSKGYRKYLKTLSYDISHKMVATRAGLGWIGKTDLFISNVFGPRLRLVSILTSRDPGMDSKPVVKSKCGKCGICVDACPAKAANGRLWDISIHRDEFFDARKCREKCGELARERLHVDERICGLCVSVCPIGRRKA